MDLDNVEYVLFVGSYPGHSGTPMQVLGRKVAKRIEEGTLKFAIVDPSVQGGNLGPNGDRSEWVPIRPGTDGAFAMSIIRWLIDNDRLPAAYLQSPNLAAARKLGYNSYINATFLVIDDPAHANYRRIVRPADMGWTVAQGAPESWVVIDEATGQPKTNLETATGKLYFQGEVAGKDSKPIKVKSVMTFLKESAHAYTMDQYAAACGIPKAKIEELAREFSSHGNKVATDGMGGATAANAFYGAWALRILPHLMGAANKKGGMLANLPSWKSVVAGPRYDLAAYPGQVKPTGPNISRDGIAYETTPEYKAKVAKGENPYPSTLPWFPLGGTGDAQMMWSVINGYPYRTKIFMNWMASPFMALPGGASPKVIDAFKNPEIIPLIITLDAFMAEVAAISDYVIPDVTQYEMFGVYPLDKLGDVKSSGVKWPVVEPLTMKLADGRHANFENYVIDVAKRLGLPGFGENAIPGTDGKLYPLHSEQDFWLKAIANVAYDGTPVRDISSEEAKMQYLEDAVQPWRNSLKAEEWPKVLYVISRGGRSEDAQSQVGDNQKYAKSATPLTIYWEKAALGKSSMTGKWFSGVAGWYPEALMNGKLLDEVFPDTEWPFRGATHKPKFRSVTMLANVPVLQELSKTNHVEINSLDAEKYGIKTGDQVKVTSATGASAMGTALVRPGVARGTIVAAFGYGHWEYGARGYSVDGKQIAGDPARGTGFALNAISLSDPSLKMHYGLSDPMMGAPSRAGGRFKIEKV
ncbi:MAG TPA: molybdopterin dinucleotide binding domain-containing protein [Symbiobacteriaceae bacterium]|nr:molybdopterin dinucleotide binding domain-containing protein [Symbiobacteriaceae bacterium]